MKRLNRLIFVLMILPTLLCSCKGNDTATDPDPVQSFHNDMLREVKRSEKLAFASMTVTKTVVADDSKFWGKRIGLYSYDTFLRAYIDLSLLSADDLAFDEENHTVHLNLPPVKVEINGRDMTLREEYTNIGMLRSRFDSRERAEAKEAANRDFKKELQDNESFRTRLSETAQRKARDYFESFFAANGYKATVDFKK